MKEQLKVIKVFYFTNFRNKTIKYNDAVIQFNLKNTR